MKIAVVGLGAVGGLIAGRLARAGYAVSGVARGATLAAIQRDGLQVRIDGTQWQAPITASADPRDLGPQDLVVLALKGPALDRRRADAWRRCWTSAPPSCRR